MSVTTYSRKTGVPLFGDVGEKGIITTRFYEISSGTSGAIAIPGYAEIIENDFGGTVDAVISAMSAGKPTFQNALTSGSVVVATTLDTSGNYSLSGTPASYPVALIYRVRTPLENFDSDSSDIIGIPTIVSGGGGGGGGTPGGSDTQVQFNDGGAFGGDAGLTYNKTTDVLTAGGVLVSGLTASQLTATDASKNLQSLSTATYPSLTELTYVKGVTSAIQTQIAAKAVRQQTDFISGYIATVADGEIIVVLKIPYAITITNLITKCTSGTCTLTGRIDGVNLGGTANSVSTSEVDESHSSANAASAGNDISVRVTSNSSCLGLSFTIKFTRSLD